MQDNIYSVKLDIFEGPMDLLTYLVRKNDLDIYNIPISFITDEYLSYIELMKSLDIDYAAEFLYMAATLAHIKSKMLLPANDDPENEDEEDPLMEITRPLIEYLQLKLASEALNQRDILDQDTFKRQTDITPQDKNAMVNIGLLELIETFKELSEKSYHDHHVDFTTNTLSVKDKIDEIISILKFKKSVTFESLVKINYSKSTIVITFLALLEMLKLNLIEIKQHIQSGIIRVFYL